MALYHTHPTVKPNSHACTKVYIYAKAMFACTGMLCMSIGMQQLNGHNHFYQFYSHVSVGLQAVYAHTCKLSN